MVYNGCDDMTQLLSVVGNIKVSVFHHSPVGRWFPVGNWYVFKIGCTDSRCLKVHSMHIRNQGKQTL